MHRIVYYTIPSIQQRDQRTELSYRRMTEGKCVFSSFALSSALSVIVTELRMAQDESIHHGGGDLHQKQLTARNTNN